MRLLVLPGRVTAAGLALLVGGLAGCGPQICTVTGKVALQGEPVTGGSVVLYCDGSHIVRGLIGPDGSYEIPNVPRGHARVTVAPPAILPEGMRKKYHLPPVVNGPVVPAARRPAANARAAAIPGRYGVPEESGLSVTVGRRVTEFDINLSR